MTTDREFAIAALETRIKNSNPNYTNSTKFFISDKLIDLAVKHGANNVFLGTEVGKKYLEIEFSGTVGLDYKIPNSTSGGGTVTGKLTYSQLNGWSLRSESEAGAVVNYKIDSGVVETGVKFSNELFEVSGGVTENGSNLETSLDAKLFKVNAGITRQGGELVEANFGVSRDFVPGNLVVEPGVTLVYKDGNDIVNVFADQNYHREGNYRHIAQEAHRAFVSISDEVMQDLGGDATYTQASEYFKEIIRQNIEEDGLPEHVALAIAVYSYADDPSEEFNPLTASLEDSIALAAGRYEPVDDAAPVNKAELTEEGIVEQLEITTKVEVTQGKLTSVGSFPFQVTYSDGTVEEKSFNPARRKAEEFESNFANTIVNGTIISENTDTLINPDGSISNVSVALMSDNEGNLYQVKSNQISESGSPSANGFLRTELVTRFAVDGITVTGVNQKTSMLRDGRIYETTEFQESPDDNWSIRQTLKDLDGTILDDGPLFVVPDAGLLQAFQFVGNTAGGLLEDHLADGDVYKGIIYSSVIKTIGTHFGTFTAFLAAGGELQAAVDAGLGVELVGQQTAVITAEFMDTFYSNLNAATSSTLSNLIVSEVGEAIGIDGTIGGEVFNVVGNTITTGVISETFGFLFQDLPSGLYTGLLSGTFDFSSPFYDPSLTGGGVTDGQIGPPVPNTTVGEFVQLQIFNALGAYAGNRLAGEVIQPESEVAAIFGAAGSALGTAVAAGSLFASTAVGTVFKAIGAALGGPVGIAIGAFVGTVVGTAFGNLFGSEDEPQAWAHLAYDAEGKEFYVGSNWGSDGGDPLVAQSMAEQAVQGVNDIIEASQGKLRSGAIAPRIQIGFEGNEFLVAVDGGGVKSFGTTADAVMFAAFHIMKNLDLVGGHMVMMRAWHNSDATNIYEWLEDIQVAEAFQNYLNNPTAILAMMMDSPESELAQSWAAILQRAAELELHLPHEKDLDGGWNEILLAQGISSDVVPSLTEDTLTITNPITGEETVMHHVIGPGYEIIRIEGTDGNDTIQVIVDGPSISYVNGGEGDDVIDGSDQADILVGGTGEDIINGHEGNDWLHGGAGDDTLDGGAGDDLVVGGEDNDYLIGNSENDHIYGNGGDDFLYGGEGQDFMFGGRGNDILDGGESDYDEVHGGLGDDTIYTGRYWQKLWGDEGNDTFIIDDNDRGNSINISRGDGHDVIQGTSSYSTYLTFDSTISAEELFFRRQDDDLKVSILGEDQSVTIKEYYGDVSERPNIMLRTYGGSIRGINTNHSNRGGINILTANDNTVSVDPLGQYNIITDADMVAGRSDATGSLSWQLTNDLSGAIFLGNASTAYRLGTTQTVSGARTYGYDFSHNQNLATGKNIGILYAGAGDDTILDRNENRFSAIYGDSGNDTIYGYGGGDTLVGGLGDDHVYGGTGKDKIYGSSGEDYLDGGSDADTIDGGADNDIIFAGTGDDDIKGGHGDDVIDAGIGNDLIKGDSGNDVIISDEGDDTAYGGDGDDNILGDEGEDTIFGDEGDDVIDGGADNDWISGGEGHDTLDGGMGDDTINAGSGNDNLIYVYGENYNAQDEYDGGAGNDKLSLYFTAAEYATVNFDREILRFKSHQYANAHSNLLSHAVFTFVLFGLVINNVEDIDVYVENVLNDTLELTINMAALHQETIDGTNGHDVVIGNELNNNIEGLDGDDDLRGAGGDDIIESGVGEDIAYGGSGDDVINGNQGQDNLYGEKGSDTISGGADDDYVEGNTGDDILIGGSGNDHILGGDGHDTIEGGLGDDYLVGGAGNDSYIFNIGDGNDVIEDSAGYDLIQFGENITLSMLNFTRTDLVDLTITLEGFIDNSIKIINQFVSGNEIEKIVFHDNSELSLTEVFPNVAPTAGNDYFVMTSATSVEGNLLTDNGSGLDFDSDGDDISVHAGVFSTEQGGSIEILENGDFVYTNDTGFLGNDTFNYTLSDGYVETNSGAFSVEIKLPEIIGTDANNTLYGTDSAEVIKGLDGTDYLYGYEGDDQLFGGSGNDYLYGADGNDTLYGDEGSDTLYGGAGDDYIEDLSATGTISGYVNRMWGGKGNDILIGGEGRNLYYEGYGDATYNYIEDRGTTDDYYALYGGTEQTRITDMGGFLDRQSLNHGILSNNNVIFERYLNDDLVIKNTAGTVNLVYTDQFTDLENTTGIGVESVFMNYAWVNIKSKILNYSDIIVTRGSAEDDVINGINILNTDDEIHAGAGNDIISGDAGDDIIYGQAGDDIINGGIGSDKLRGNTGFDTIYGGDGSDNIRGQQDDDFIYGGAGNDVLYGDNNSIDTYAGNDTLDGGMGDDTLRGGLGDDTYIVSDGLDYLYDRGGSDVIKFNNISDINALTFLPDIDDVNDVIIQINPGINELHIENQMAGTIDFRVEKLMFNDGSMASFDTFNTWVKGGADKDVIYGSHGRDDTLLGYDNNDKLYGKNGDDELFGGLGDDYLRGDGGNDLLHGGGGSDYLRGNDGDDVLYAGAGYDKLSGDGGADEFIFSGVETFDGKTNRIVDFDSLEGDTISLIDGLIDYDPLTDAISDFVTITESSRHTYIGVDRDGQSNGHDKYYAVRLDNVTGEWTDVNDAIAQGGLIVN